LQTVRSTCILDKKRETSGLSIETGFLAEIALSQAVEGKWCGGRAPPTSSQTSKGTEMRKS
jgi:hypothetical protein